MSSNADADLAKRGSPMNRLRDRLAELIGADCWVDGAYPAVQPQTGEQVAKLLRGYPSPIVVVGSGSNFRRDFNPGNDALVLLTRRLRDSFELIKSDQVLLVSAGWPVDEVNLQLAKAGYGVSALARFSAGSVGGRLASVPSRPQRGDDCGWMQHLLGMEVVLSSGEILRLGGRCIKDVAGYDLKHMFTGTRGAVGVIVRAAFRCRPIQPGWTVPPFNNLKETSRIDPRWRRLFDPMGRMMPGA